MRAHIGLKLAAKLPLHNRARLDGLGLPPTGRAARFRAIDNRPHRGKDRYLLFGVVDNLHPFHGGVDECVERKMLEDCFGGTLKTAAVMGKRWRR